MPYTLGWNAPVAFEQHACHAETLFLNIVILLVFGKPHSQCWIAAISHGACALSATARHCLVSDMPVLAGYELGAVACP